MIEKNIQEELWNQLNEEATIKIDGENYKVTALEKIVWKCLNSRYADIQLPLWMEKIDLVMDIAQGIRKKLPEAMNKFEWSPEMLISTKNEKVKALYNIYIVNYIYGTKSNYGFVKYYMMRLKQIDDRKKAHLRKNGVMEIRMPLVEDDNGEESEIEVADEYIEYKDRFKEDCQLFAIIDDLYQRTEVRALAKTVCNLLANGFDLNDCSILLNKPYNTLRKYVTQIKKASGFENFKLNNGFIEPKEYDFSNEYIEKHYGTKAPDKDKQIEYYRQFIGVEFSNGDPKKYEVQRKLKQLGLT